MAKIKKIYSCQNCGNQSSQWQGQCSECGEWNTFVEEIMASPSSLGGASASSNTRAATPISMSKVTSKKTQRITTGIEEFNRVLGGGFVPGQVVLLAGAPGVGKSTILTTLAQKIKKPVLYICGEESVEQIKVRVERMGYSADNLVMLPETNVEVIAATLESEKGLELVIVDSIQTLYSDLMTGLAGSITQVRGCTQIITNVAKRIGLPVVLVGHVTKEGVVAGPRVLEHIVDTVLYLEGDSNHMFRILRTTKNRFGPVSEVGIFEMQEKGMVEVANPSELFLSQRDANASGSCVTVIMEGYRPILFEIQALTVGTNFGYPRRTASGFSVTRLQVLIAILEKRCGLNLSGHDVYLSVAGGLKVNEYAADLAVCLAIASALADRPVKTKVSAFGECGLNGEVRNVAHQAARTKESKKLGYTGVISSDVTKTVKKAIELGLELPQAMKKPNLKPPK